jgi:hypothetical protein
MAVKKIYLIFGIIFSLLIIASVGVWVFQRTNLKFSKFFRVELTENPTYIFSSDFDSEKVTLYGIGIGDYIKEKRDFEKRIKKRKDLFINFYDYKDIFRSTSETSSLSSQKCFAKFALLKNKDGEEIAKFLIINDRVEIIFVENPIIQQLAIHTLDDLVGRLGVPEKNEKIFETGAGPLVRVREERNDYSAKGIFVFWREGFIGNEFTSEITEIAITQKGKFYDEILKECFP